MDIFPELTGRLGRPTLLIRSCWRGEQGSVTTAGVENGNISMAGELGKGNKRASRYARTLYSEEHLFGQVHLYILRILRMLLLKPKSLRRNERALLACRMCAEDGCGHLQLVGSISGGRRGDARDEMGWVAGCDG